MYGGWEIQTFPLTSGATLGFHLFVIGALVTKTTLSTQVGFVTKVIGFSHRLGHRTKEPGMEVSKISGAIVFWDAWGVL